MNTLVPSSLALLRATQMCATTCQLPAVPTLDWCDKAALCLTDLSQNLTVSVSLVTIDPSGRIKDHELTGVARKQDAINLISRTLPNSQQDEVLCDPSLKEQRRKFERAKQCDLIPGTLSIPLEGLCQLHDHKRGIVGIIPLPDTRPGRVLWTRLTTTLHSQNLTQMDASVFQAVHTHMALRARLAMGTKPMNAGQFLTLREQEVLDYLTLGWSVKNIAQKIDRSPHTVHDHVKSLHRKLNASSRGQLIALALGHLQPPNPPSPDGPDNDGLDRSSQLEVSDCLS